MKSINAELKIASDKIVDTPETRSIYSNDKKPTYKMDRYISHTFILVTIFLLKIVIISHLYYCIEHQSKQKDILPY